MFFARAWLRSSLSLSNRKPEQFQAGEMMRQLRKDDVTAWKIDIALVQQKISGTASARRYLQAESIAEEVIERVLAEYAARPEMAGAGITMTAALYPDAGAVEESEPAVRGRPSPYSATGKRRDVIRAAMVQAAIAILELRDPDRAERLLRREGLPDPVIDRILGDGPRRGYYSPQAQ
jgi:hypothetical protein